MNLNMMTIIIRKTTNILMKNPHLIVPKQDKFRTMS